MREHFHLFAYGTLRRGGRSEELLQGAEWVGHASVGGVLYDIDGQHPALVLYGSTPVEGDLWRCPIGLLPVIDQYESVESGLFRRIGVKAQTAEGADYACWTYVAGPALTRKLTPARRIERWTQTG